jgi:formimidoylglutamate deiminase
VADPVVLPGFVNAHSHTFQRAMRGRRTGGDFWAWREAMIGEAERQTPETVRQEYADTYTEMRAAGYTAVGEFHYLGLPEARAAAEAAREAGIELTVFLTAYARGGSPRFRQNSAGEYLDQVEELSADGLRLGCAPHSVRACPRDWFEEIGRYASDRKLPLHVHAAEQPREVEECLAEYGLRPIELLAETGCLGPRTTVVHATHADDRELDLLAAGSARVCLCPTTEGNLGDGFAPLPRLREREIGICIGSDSNLRIDPFEELRELETNARRMTGRREVCSVEMLLSFGTGHGASSIGVGAWPSIEIDAGHPSLRGVDRRDLLDALVFGCSADVVAAHGS